MVEIESTEYAATTTTTTTTTSKSKSHKISKSSRNKGELNVELEQPVVVSDKKKSKKRAAAADLDQTAQDIIDAGNEEALDGVLVNDDINEPTMGEKLASLVLEEDDIPNSPEKQQHSSLLKPPSADSLNVVLKQALHADDRALLLNCLYTQDDKVITNSISVLNSSDVMKLLQTLVSIIESKGAVLACALPWLRCLLLQHASGILSQESSSHALNSLYQLTESRISSFQSALQVSSCLDSLYSGIVDDDGADDNDTIIPVVYLNDDDSEEESEDDEMETDEDSSKGELSDEVVDGIDDFDLDGLDDMSD
ncbi:hypothetical protein ACFE04_012487 [Oxalis oulophora]